MRLENLGHHVLDTSFNGKDAIIKTGIINPDLVLMDIQLNGEMNGIDTAKQIYELYNIPFIYLTGSHNKKIIERANQTKPSGFIHKPFNDSEIQIAIDNAIQQK